MKNSNLFITAARSASYTMFLQLAFRLLTFLANAILLRFINKDMLGVVNVRLMLLYSTIVFITREPFRRSCLNTHKDHPWQQTINLIWCGVPISIFAATLLGYVWSFLLELPNPDTVPHYHIGVIYFAISTVIEMFAEPLWVVAREFLFVKLKVFIEGVMLMTRCLIGVFLIILWPQLGLKAFCIAQIVGALVYVILHYIYFGSYIFFLKKKDDDFPFSSLLNFCPRKIYGMAWTSWSLATLTWSFFKQSFLKQILTEGERFIMTVFGVLSFGDQGIYDVINNLGSLAARFIFLPIEESCYLYFSKTFKRGLPIEEQDKATVDTGSKVLHIMLKVVTLIGLTILVFGYAYSYLLLDIYGGEMLSSGSGPNLLRWFCIYVLFIAVNGVSESFVFSAMSQKDVDSYNHKMLLFSIIFLLSSWSLTKLLGSIGFILANCLNMLARILHSAYYIIKYFKNKKHRPLTALLPTGMVLASYSLSFFVTMLSEIFFCCDHGLIFRVIHVSIGVYCLLGTLAAVFFKETELMEFTFEVCGIKNIPLRKISLNPLVFIRNFSKSS